jgi:pimeloyl-ACP methyl ester carboxylesterase
MPLLTLQNPDCLSYELIDGDDSRPYLVFLHEGLGCTEMWKDFPLLLCKETGCPGLVYDRIGYGKSSPLTEPMTIHFMHRHAFFQLPEIIRRLIPDKDFILIGHSDGGSISLIFASERPSRLIGMITEGAHVFVEQKTLSGIRAAVDTFHSGGLGGLFKYHGEKTEKIFTAWSDVWLSRAFGFWNIEYALPSIETPCLVLQGTQDCYGTAAQVESIVTNAPHAKRCMMEHCGHAPHLENSGQTLQVMKKFIETLLVAAGAPNGCS